MHTPINTSVAGVVGLSNTREAKLHAAGATPVVSNVNQIAKPLEENTNAGDRDAQEQYHRSSDQRPKQQNSDVPRADSSQHLLDLPAEDDSTSTLDTFG